MQIRLFLLINILAISNICSAAYITPPRTQRPDAAPSIKKERYAASILHQAQNQHMLPAHLAVALFNEAPAGAGAGLVGAGAGLVGAGAGLVGAGADLVGAGADLIGAVHDIVEAVGDLSIDKDGDHKMAQ